VLGITSQEAVSPRTFLQHNVSFRDFDPVVSTGRTTQAQGYRPGLVGPVLVGFQASLALLSNQALW
jgi:hypothetical protein